MIILKEQIVSDYVVTDLETTGLSPENDRIIEIAAVRVRNNEITDTYSTLIDPLRHISREITAITGIDDSMVKGKPLIGEAMQEFMRFVGNTPLLGHNIIHFDLQFLKRQAEINNHCIDTLMFSQHVLPESSGYSLSALCTRFGIKNLNAHRAEYDCIATHEVYCKLKSLYKDNGAYLNMAVSCSRKAYQNNIRQLCRTGTDLTYSANEKGELAVFAQGEPIGTISGGKQRELEANSELVRKLTVSRISEGAGGKLLLGAQAHLKP